MYIKDIYFFQGEVTSCLYEIKPGCPGQVVKKRTFGHGNRPVFTHLQRWEPAATTSQGTEFSLELSDAKEA